MSLTTDEIFYRALMADKDLVKAVGGRIRSTCFEVPPTEQDNTPLPYIIITLDGMTNDPSTKDGLEGDYDTTTVSLEIADKSRVALGRLAQMARQSVRTYLTNISEEDEDYEHAPEDYQLSASGVMWDDRKPCYFQILTYQCSTPNDTE